MWVMFSPKYPNLQSYCFDSELIYHPEQFCPSASHLFIQIWAKVYQFWGNAIGCILKTLITAHKRVIKSVHVATYCEHNNPRFVR